MYSGQKTFRVMVLKMAKSGFDERKVANQLQTIYAILLPSL